jgi:hypothetical protein
MAGYTEQFIPVSSMLGTLSGVFGWLSLPRETDAHTIQGDATERASTITMKEAGWK